MGREREDARSTKLHGAVARDARRESDIDAWKQIRQQHSSFSCPVDLEVDVPGPYAVAVAVLNGADGDAVFLFLKAERDRGGTTDGLGARERHPRGQIAGGGKTA